MHELSIEEKLRMEQDNIDWFKQNTLSDDTPFSSGKILDHIDRVYDIKHCPEAVAPITIELHLTNICQHKCPSCMYRDSIHNTPDRLKHIELKDALKLVRDAYTMGVKGIVYSGGGEPLAYPYIDEIMEYATSLGISQGLITNGGLLGRHINSVATHCDWVRISLDAGSWKIRQLTHGVDDYKDTLTNIRSLVAIKRDEQRIGVSFLVTAQNFSDISEATQTAKNLGLNYIQIKPMIMSNEEKIKTGNILWDKRIQSYIKEALGRATSSFKVFVLWQQFAGNIDGHKNFTRCHGHALYPVITATGDVYVCCMQIGNKDKCYGNINDASLIDIWTDKNRFNIGDSIDVSCCPKLCRLGQTNTLLEDILVKRHQDSNFLN